MNSHRLWYTKGANNFNEALPLGNGRMGAMVYGKGSSETITLNEDTLWGGYPRISSRQCSDSWKKVTQLVEAKKYQEAVKLLEQHHFDYNVQPYLPLGTLHIRTLTQDPQADVKRELNLATACHETVFRCGDQVFHQEVFISHPHQVLVLRLREETGKKISAAVCLDGALSHKKSENENTLYIQGNCPQRREPNCTPGGIYCYHEDPAQQGVGYRAGVRVVADGGTIFLEESSLKILDAQQIVLYFAVRTSFNGPFRHPVLDGREYVHACQTDLDNAVSIGYPGLLQAHLQAHQALYERCRLDLGESDNSALPTDQRLLRHAAGEEDPALYALLMHYGRYLMISASRPGTQPTNLQGIWNESLTPPWNCNYTTNINTEMNYWPAMTANLGECIQPLVEMLKELRVPGRVIAKNYYGANGFCSHHNGDIWRTSHPCGGRCQWGQWPMSTGWICRMAYDVYRYTLDEAYLKELLPVLQESAAFYISLLKEQDGYFLLFPSTSPENNYVLDGDPCPLDDTATMSVAIVRDVLRCTAETLEHFGQDASYYRDIQKKLLPHRITSDGRLAEWYHDYEDWDVHHRHVSHLYSLYPSEQINIATPELMDACRATLEKRGDESTGWSLAWKINLWARLRDSERALHLVKLALAPVSSVVTGTSQKGGIYPNLFCAHPPFQIDGNFGACAGILEMLVQIDENGEPVLLPALPQSWKNGSLTGMCLPGKRTLSMQWVNGKVTEYSIEQK